MSNHNKVRAYTDKELMNKVKSLPSFQYIPKDYWIIGIRSNEDTYDVFDDKFYIFRGEQFIDVMSGTTNSGSYGLYNYKLWDKRGVAHIKDNEFYYDVWTRGKHNGKVDALRQTGPFKVIRDNNNNDISGDITQWSWEVGKGLNFHPNTYNLTQKIKRVVIGKWSTGCQVVNDIPRYKNLLIYTEPQRIFSYCLLEEF